MIYNVVLLSAMQQSESDIYIYIYMYICIYIHIHISTLLKIIFWYRSLQEYWVDLPVLYIHPCWLSILYMCVFSCSVVSDSLRPHGLYIAFQAPLSMEFFQARISEWVAISCSRRSSEPRDWTYVLHLLQWQMDSLPLHHLGNPILKCVYVNPNLPIYTHALPLQ